MSKSEGSSLFGTAVHNNKEQRRLCSPSLNLASVEMASKLRIIEKILGGGGGGGGGGEA